MYYYKCESLSKQLYTISCNNRYQLYLTYLISNTQYNNFPHIAQLTLCIMYMKHVYEKHVKSFKLTCIREKKNTQLLFQAVVGNESERKPAGRESRDGYKRVAGHLDENL